MDRSSTGAEAEEDIGTRLLCVSDLIKKLQMSKATIYAYEDDESDQFLPDFPKHIKLGRARRYYLHEIDAYLESLGNKRKA
ncbi:helix-turn-helix transcriptional regulator [Luteimonas changyuni]|uniref:helix-turn-helix transcriptional regulator n=1 Tax=Luteimonas sp. MJ145 TaxID=3129234 RepID=UPI0031BB0F77